MIKIFKWLLVIIVCAIIFGGIGFYLGQLKGYQSSLKSIGESGTRTFSGLEKNTFGQTPGTSDLFGTVMVNPFEE